MLASIHLALLLRGPGFIFAIQTQEHPELALSSILISLPPPEIHHTTQSAASFSTRGPLAPRLPHFEYLPPLCRASLQLLLLRH